MVEVANMSRMAGGRKMNALNLLTGLSTTAASSFERACPPQKKNKQTMEGKPGEIPVHHLLLKYRPHFHTRTRTQESDALAAMPTCRLLLMQRLMVKTSRQHISPTNMVVACRNGWLNFFTSPALLAASSWSAHLHQTTISSVAETRRESLPAALAK